MPTLWAQTSTFHNIAVGDDLPILVKFEFRMPIPDGAGALAISPKEEPVDAEKLSGYVKELLLKGFPASSVNSAATTIDVEISTDFLPGDTVSLSGYVVSKSDEAGHQRSNARLRWSPKKGLCWPQDAPRSVFRPGVPVASSASGRRVTWPHIVHGFFHNCL